MKRELSVTRGKAELRVSDKGTRTAYGTAVVFDEESHQLGYFREAIAPGAFDEYLRSKPEILALCHHDMRSIIGRTSAGTLRYSVDKTGVHIECDLPNTSYANDLAENLSRRDIQGMSFQFNALDDEWSMKDGTPFRYVKRAEIYEVSFVTDPAYPQTIAGLARSRAQYEERVRALTGAPLRTLWKYKARLLKPQ